MYNISPCGFGLESIYVGICQPLNIFPTAVSLYMYEMSCINHPAVKLDRICFVYTHTHTHIRCVCTKQQFLHAQTDVRVPSQYQRHYRFIFIFFFTVNHCWKICSNSLKSSLEHGGSFHWDAGKQPCFRLKNNLIDNLFYCYAHKNKLRV